MRKRGKIELIKIKLKTNYGANPCRQGSAEQTPLVKIYDQCLCCGINQQAIKHENEQILDSRTALVRQLGIISPIYSGTIPTHNFAYRYRFKKWN